jgi:hypothetical protein
LDKYYQTAKFKAILNTYNELLKGNNSGTLDAEDLTDICEYYHYKGMVKEMMYTLNYAINIFPGAVAPLALKARIELFNNNDIKAALTLAEEIEDTNDIEYIYLMAEILLSQDKVNEANSFIEDRYNNIFEQQEKDEYAIDIANFFLDYSMPLLAKAWLSKTNQKDTKDFHEASARLLKEEGKYEESETIYNHLLDNNPYSIEYWNELSQNQILHKDYNGAVNSCEYAIAINPEDEDAILNKATALFALNNYDDALKCYYRYKEIVSFGDTSSVDITIGHILLYQGKEKEAKNYFEHAYMVSEDKPNTMIHIAISSFENGYTNYAYNTLKAVIGNCDERWKTGYAYLARCCYELKLEDEFKKYLAVAIKRNPDESVDLLADLFPDGTDPNNYPTTPLL